MPKPGGCSPGARRLPSQAHPACGLRWRKPERQGRGRRRRRRRRVRGQGVFEHAESRASRSEQEMQRPAKHHRGPGDPLPGARTGGGQAPPPGPARDAACDGSANHAVPWSTCLFAAAMWCGAATAGATPWSGVGSAKCADVPSLRARSRALSSRSAPVCSHGRGDAERMERSGRSCRSSSLRGARSRSA